MRGVYKSTTHDNFGGFLKKIFKNMALLVYAVTGGSSGLSYFYELKKDVLAIFIFI